MKMILNVRQLLASCVSVIGCLLMVASVHAQTNYSDVYGILQTNCAVSGCHAGSGAAASMDLSGSLSAVYNQLVQKEPTNASARNRGYERIMPGYPYRSLLLKKINGGWDPANGLEDSTLGAPMPKGGPKLADADIALINEWVLHGAPYSGTPANAQAIRDYYNGLGIERVNPPPAPSPSQGFQIHLGPIFLGPQEEREYRLKHDIQLDDAYEIHQLEVVMNWESHHFIIDKFDNSGSSVQEGLRLVTNFGTAFEPNTTIVSAWQNDGGLKLPPNTAYFWDTSTLLDLNYHVRNYSFDSVVAAEVYINVYTRAKQLNTVEMFSDIVLYGGSLIIPPIGPMSFDEAVYGNVPSDSVYIWLLSSHRHKYGTDYDMYKRNPDGSRGDQLFEGFMDYSGAQPVNLGYYDWEHPPVRYFEPLLPINTNDGLIHEAKYNNTGNSIITFGLTTADEMMLYFIQYTLQNPQGTTSGVPAVSGFAGQPELKVVPNPFTESTVLHYELERAAPVQIELYNAAGALQQTIVNEEQTSGTHAVSLNAQSLQLTPGLYIARVAVDGQRLSKKLVYLK